MTQQQHPHQASAELNAKLVCSMRTPNFPPGTHDCDIKRHNLIEGVSKCMISRQEAQGSTTNTSKLFSLPSKSTLAIFLGKKQNWSWIIWQFFHELEKDIDQFSSLLYDKISSICCVSYNTYMSCVGGGLEGCVTIGKTWFMANDAVVFMVRGLANKWKQCIGQFHQLRTYQMCFNKISRVRQLTKTV